MNIAIAQRYRPYTAQLGSLLPIPGTSLAVRLWPALLEIYEAAATPHRLLGSVALATRQPLDTFTAQLDLERNTLLVWGGQAASYLRYSLTAAPDGLTMALLRGSQPLQLEADGVTLSHTTLEPHGSLAIAYGTQRHTTQDDAAAPCRLSMGCHKAQQWPHMCQRADYCELLPHYHRLAQLWPSEAPAAADDATLVDALRQAVDAADHEAAYRYLDWLCRYASVSDVLLLPHLERWRACALSRPLAHDSAAFLHGVSASFINMLVRHDGPQIALLPLPPHRHHCGRVTGLSLCGGQLLMDFEWSKKLPRRVVLRPQADMTVTLAGSRHVRSYRLQRLGHPSAQRHLIEQTIELQGGAQYHCDRFEK